MAKNAYVGLMGSGKSFEVVSSVILPAVLKGRRVVTNIDGINPEAIYTYLCEVKGGRRDTLGEVVGVTNDDVCAKGFFPDDTDASAPSIVRPGDLVCVDECWKFWSSDNKISDDHMTFFRMHRHYTHPETGVSCDIALMIQDLGTLHRKVKATVEMTCRTVKLKSLGAPKAYRCELYEGNKLNKQTKIDTHVKTYNKAIFPLYKSYAAGDGKETAIDKRQNVLSNPRIWVLLVMVIFLFSVGSFFTYRFFHQKPKTPPLPVTTVEAQAAQQGQPSTQTAKGSASDFSAEWRYAGSMNVNGVAWVILVDSQGHLRPESPSVFTGKDFAAVGTVDGQKVTSYTGGKAQSAFTPSAPSQPPPLTPGK